MQTGRFAQFATLIARLALILHPSAPNAKAPISGSTTSAMEFAQINSSKTEGTALLAMIPVCIVVGQQKTNALNALPIDSGTFPNATLLALATLSQIQKIARTATLHAKDATVLPTKTA